MTLLAAILFFSTEFELEKLVRRIQKERKPKERKMVGYDVGVVPPPSLPW